MSLGSIGPDGQPVYPLAVRLSPPEIPPKDLQDDGFGSGMEGFRCGLDLNDEVPTSAHPGPSCRMVVRCDLGYYGWVQGLADRLGLNVSQTIAQGLLRLGEASGYHYAMPRRYTPQNRARKRRPNVF